jgi:ATP-dependent helicase/nuclease subunit A
LSRQFFDFEPEEGKAYIYRSSAGSGKTFTLTKAYLKLVLRDTSRYHEILAITFTNKAKEEMKTRIVQELTKLAQDENSDMRREILLDFEREGVERIKDVITPRADTVLNLILHDYSRFNVSTIDHFFTQLIRQLAKELNLNLGYELDVDSRKALTESVELLFKNADKDLLNWLNDFALDQITNEKGWNIRKNILDLGRKLFQESFMDIESALAENTAELSKFIKAQQKILEQFKTNVITAAKEALSIALKYNLQQSDFKAGMPYSNFVKLASPSNDFAKPPSKTFMHALSPELWYKKGAEKSDEITTAFHDGMGACHARIVDAYEGEALQEYIEAKAVLAYIHSYGVLSALARSLKEYRSTNNLIFISDSPFILNKVIKESETPFIYEKMGAKYRYILIDEFQDTSYYQWKSLLPFFSNAIADGGQLIIVGDVKQSIYGWRGGDLSLLLKKVEQDIKVPSENILKLDTNYRSAKNIITFNNSFFSIAAGMVPEMQGIEQFQSDFKLAYADVTQHHFQKYDGYVEAKFFENNDDSSWKDQSREETKLAIENAIRDGYRYSDILLLTRKKDESKDIANALLTEGIPALSETALRITSSAKVQLLISAIKYYVNKSNSLALAEFNAFAFEVFKQKTALYTDESSLISGLSKLRHTSTFELLEELILSFNLENEIDIYIQKLLDLALDQSLRGNSSPIDFLSWWSEQEDSQSDEFSITTPESDDAVLVLTIHKAKGLEKPVVIIPFADDEIKPKSDVFWAKPLPDRMKTWGSLPVRFSEDLSKTGFKEAYYKHYFDSALEALNLLYVAFTRPKERLYVFSPESASARSSATLIKKVFEDQNFELSAKYDQNTKRFVYGNQAPSEHEEKEVGQSELLHVPSSAIPEGLVVDHSKSQLFLTVHSEKSEKVREGIILHKVLSLIKSQEDLGPVLEQLTTERLINQNQVPVIRSKLALMFKNIPELTTWFSDAYEVINERQIFAKREVLIPDRVMVKNNAAIIVDYKREKKSQQHINQIKSYGKVLAEMGYDPIALYLLYIDDQNLIEVN